MEEICSAKSGLVSKGSLRLMIEIKEKSIESECEEEEWFAHSPKSM